MNTTDKYPLEYQEVGGNLHYNNSDGIPAQNTSGYKTIALCTFEQFYEFSNFIKSKYNFRKRPYPTFQIIEYEWNEWYKSKIPM